MPYGYSGYKRPYGLAFGHGNGQANYGNVLPYNLQRNVRQRTYGPYLGSFHGRSVRRYGRAPFRTGGFGPRPARAAMGLNRRPGTVERKFKDTLSTASQLDTTGTVVLLNGMAQGATQSTRVGNKITMKSVQIRMQFINGTSSVAPIIRWMIIYDKQTNGVLPAITDVLVLSTVTSMMNLANRDRFVILAEETFAPAAVWSDTAATAEFMEFHKRYIKLNLDTIYNNSSTGLVGDVQTGSLLLVTLSNTASGLEEPALDFTSRIRYTDM